MPVKQAVISASALSLLYPSHGIAGYPREAFLANLIDEAEADIRGALDAGAANVQIDFTEARLSLKLDPSGNLLRSFVALNNQVLDRFTPEERVRIGVHVCPGGDHDSTHSADIDYAALLPDLFQLNVGRFYLQMASEPDRKRILRIVAGLLGPHHLVFIGVIDPIHPVVETAAQVRDRVLEAASFLPIQQLGTTDDCGFAPFADDTSTARDIAFSKIRARVEGTELAARELGVLSIVCSRKQLCFPLEIIEELERWSDARFSNHSSVCVVPDIDHRLSGPRPGAGDHWCHDSHRPLLSIAGSKCSSAPSFLCRPSTT